MKTKKLIKLYNVLDAIITCCVVVGVLSFFVIYGCIGSFDYAVETHTMLSEAEETKLYASIFIGIFTIGLCSLVSWFCGKVRDIAGKELDCRVEKRHQRQTEIKRRRSEIMMSVNTTECSQNNCRNVM